MPGGIEPNVERVYNSKSSHPGIFGFGWGNDFEVYLQVAADGSVVVHENGGGAQNRFIPPNISQTDIENGVEAIMAAKSKTMTMSKQARDADLARLRADALYRNEEWELLFNKGLVKARPIVDGTVLRSNKFSYQVITKVKDGYQRRHDNGKVETFNSLGKLARVVDKNGNFINMTYDRTGHLATMQDNLNRKIYFTFNKNGKVEKVQSDAKVAQYKYSGDELVYSKDAAGNVYEYKYSSNGRHNLVEIKYADKTTFQIGYNTVEEGETVKWTKDRDGSVSDFTYGGEKGPAAKYLSTSIVTKGPEGKVLSKAKYEYWDVIKQDGVRYTQKFTSEVDGEKLTTINNDLELPIEITKNGEKTSFAYDAKGHVTKKMTPTEVTELDYDPVHNKVSRVKKYPPGKTNDKKAVQSADYTYDQHGNLAAAKNSEGKAVKIVYDHIGRIKALIDQDKRQLQFKYNDANRPVEIMDPAVGKIDVRYAPSGDILKVDSSGGRKIALQVTSAFQNLLDIIRPAGVTLSF